MLEYAIQNIGVERVLFGSDFSINDPGEVIAAIRVPATPVARRSHYLKVRERASFEFALVSAAVAIDMDGDRIRGIVSPNATAAYLVIVREFEEGDEDFDEATLGLDPHSNVRRLGGQHHFGMGSRQRRNSAARGERRRH